MDVSPQRKGTDEQPEPQPESELVTVHRSSPDRTVFTEEGNTDGWISTDLTVTLER